MANLYKNKVVYGGQTLIDISDTTATAATILSGYGCYGADGAWIDGTASSGGGMTVVETQDEHGGTIVTITGEEVVLQSKTVTPSTSTQTVLPDEGKTGLAQVTVNPIPSQYIIPSGTKTITENGTGIDVASYASVNVAVTAPGVELQAKTHIEPTESSQTITPDSGYDGLSSVQIDGVGSTYVGSGITRRSSMDLTASGATVTVPAGYYSAQASKSVAGGTAGTPTATKGTVSNHSISVTPSVTNTSGYIVGGTKNGTAVTVSASELVSGSQTVTENGTVDVTNLASVNVAIPIVHYYTGSSAPSASLGSNGDIYLQTGG